MNREFYLRSCFAISHLIFYHIYFIGFGHVFFLIFSLPLHFISACWHTESCMTSHENKNDFCHSVFDSLMFFIQDACFLFSYNSFEILNIYTPVTTPTQYHTIEHVEYFVVNMACRLIITASTWETLPKGWRDNAAFTKDYPLRRSNV